MNRLCLPNLNQILAIRYKNPISRICPDKIFFLFLSRHCGNEDRNLFFFFFFKSTHNNSIHVEQQSNMLYFLVLFLCVIIFIHIFCLYSYLFVCVCLSLLRISPLTQKKANKTISFLISINFFSSARSAYFLAAHTPMLFWFFFLFALLFFFGEILLLHDDQLNKRYRMMTKKNTKTNSFSSLTLHQFKTKGKTFCCCFIFLFVVCVYFLCS